jgi:hypothetical protein
MFQDDACSNQVVLHADPSYRNGLLVEPKQILNRQQQEQGGQQWPLGDID